MKACIVGVGVVEFVDEEKGEVIEGAKVYYFAPKDEVDGFFAGSLWVKKKSKMYDKVLALDVTTPLLSEIEYEQQPGSKRIISQLVGIRPLDATELAQLSGNVFWQDVVNLMFMTVPKPAK